MSNTNLLICYNSLPLFADHVLDYPEDYYAQFGVGRLHNKDIFKYSDVKDGDVIFVKTDFIENGKFYTDVWPYIDAKIKLVTGVSSLPGPKGNGVEEILESDKLIAWYPCHVNPEYGYHPKVFPVPIGFTEQNRVNGNQEVLWDCRNKRIPFEDKSDSLFLPYHDLTTNKVRQRIINSISESGANINLQPEKLHIKECLEYMDKSKYIICMEGSGIDTHRVYECLLIDCVPIMKRTPLERMFKDYNLPGIFIDSWDEIDENFIETIDETKFDFSNNERFLLSKTHGDFILNHVLSNDSNVISG